MRSSGARWQRGQQPLPGGSVELQFELHTHPGGAPTGAVPGLVKINVHLSLLKDGIRVDREGRFSFEAQAEYHLDSAGGAGGITIWNDEQRHDSVKGSGVIADDNTLALKLEWTHGPGRLIYTTIPGGTFSVQQPAVATPHVMEWKLAPALRRVEELGDDRGRETITYKARRPSTVVGTQAAPMTERIEVKLVRGLVPRG